MTTSSAPGGRSAKRVFQLVHRPDSFELVLDDQGHRNAFRLTTARELRGILRQMKSTSRRGEETATLIYRAKGHVFCAGGHLHDYEKMGSAAGRKANREIAAIIDELRAWPGPSLAIIEGDVLGGGLEMLAAFDAIWSVPEAMFGFWQRRVGLSFGWGGERRLRDRLSLAKLRYEILAARALTAEAALDLGLIDAIVPRASIEADLRTWTQRQRELSLATAQASKSILEASSTTAARRIFDKLWWSPEHRARLKAFTRS